LKARPESHGTDNDPRPLRKSRTATTAAPLTMAAVASNTNLAKGRRRRGSVVVIGLGIVRKDQYPA
jgi:hypothetical protein